MRESPFLDQGRRIAAVMTGSVQSFTHFYLATLRPRRRIFDEWEGLAQGLVSVQRHWP